jgi:hypothetical protein
MTESTETTESAEDDMVYCDECGDAQVDCVGDICDGCYQYHCDECGLSRVDCEDGICDDCYSLNDDDDDDDEDRASDTKPKEVTPDDGTPVA